MILQRPGAGARSHLVLCLLAFLLIGGSARVSAQTATITGLVTDPDGLVVPGLAVTVLSMERGVSRDAVTNTDGYYTVGLLTQGTYELSVALDGFKAVRRQNLRLDEGQVMRVDVRLEVGGNAETVTVLAERPLLDSQATAQSTVVTGESVRDMPLSGRNPIALAALIPGVRPVGNFGGLSTSSYGDNQISISGASPSVNNVMVDGIAAENHTSGSLQIPLSPDATEEFRVITRNASAEYGRTGGGVINFVSKAGTNSYKGAAWEFSMNRGLSWNDHFSIKNGRDKVPFSFHQYGAAVGGPIVRARTFFFANWEGARRRTRERSVLTVPTDRQLAGDFSQTYDANGKLIVIYDPRTTRPDPNSPGRYIRDPFPGNVIPAGRLNATAQAIAAYYPRPNLPGAPNTGANNYQGEDQSETTKDLYGLRIDHYFRSARRLFGRYTKDDTASEFPAYFGGTPADPGTSPTSYPKSSAVLNYSDTLSQNVLLEGRVGRNRFGIDRTPRSQGFDVTAIGMPAALNTEAQFMSFP